MTRALPEWLDSLSARHGQQTALVFGEVTVSFDDLSERSQSIATGLRRRGIDAGDTVAVWLLNEPDWLAIFFACARIGAIVIAVNTRFRMKELVDMISRTRPKAIFYRARLGSVSFGALITEAVARTSAPPILEIVVGPDADSAMLTLNDLIGRAGSLDAVNVTPEEGAVIFATSGTTSRRNLSFIHTGLLSITRVMLPRIFP